MPNESYLPNAVEIRYNGEPIPALYKVSIAFWNAGRKTLDHTDVARSDPIRISFGDDEETKVLEIRSKAVSREVINGNFTLTDNTIFVSFDFLDHNDGLACEVFYTGTETDVSFDGTIKGASKGIRQRPFNPTTVASPLPFKFMPQRFSLALLVVVTSLIYIGIGIQQIVSMTQGRHHSPVDWVNFFPVLIGIIGIYYAMVLYFQRMPRRLWKNILSSIGASEGREYDTDSELDG